MDKDEKELHDLAHMPEMAGTLFELAQGYLQFTVRRDYALNAGRGGRSETPDFAWQQI